MAKPTKEEYDKFRKLHCKFQAAGWGLPPLREWGEIESDQTWPSPNRRFREIHGFTIRGGRQIVDGKSFWPNLLRLEFSHERDAWDMVRQLLAQLEGERENFVFNVSLVGKLREDDE